IISTQILIFNQKHSNNEIIENIFITISIISCFVCIYSSIIRFWEYEKINGEFKGEISFEENGIQINEKLYFFSEIKNLDISYGNKFGDKTNNTKSGPYYSQGLDNHISFYHNSKFIKTYFQLYSKTQYDAIQKDLFYYVINEVFPFERKNLDFIDKQFHHYSLYKAFIEKMKREGKLS
ncbi:MAG: hypothetical protein RI943_551, partial [Bacteroidota bacterium]